MYALTPKFTDLLSEFLISSYCLSNVKMLEFNDEDLLAPGVVGEFQFC